MSSSWATRVVLYWVPRSHLNISYIVGLSSPRVNFRGRGRWTGGTQTVRGVSSGPVSSESRRRVSDEGSTPGSPTVGWNPCSPVRSLRLAPSYCRGPRMDVIESSEVGERLPWVVVGQMSSLLAIRRQEIPLRGSSSSRPRSVPLGFGTVGGSLVFPVPV